MFIYQYNVTFLDQSVEDIDLRETNESGLTCGESFANAVQRLEEFYGEDLIALNYLIAIDDCGCLPRCTIEDLDWME